MGSPSNCAIHYFPNEFEVGSAKVLGRQSAAAGFLKGFARHSGVETLYCCSPREEYFRSFQETVAHHGAHAACEWISYNEPGKLAVTGCLYQADPGISELAWQRRRYGAAAFSLCGVTHTLCSTVAMDLLAGLAVAPVEAWDALVCTSTVARQAVERVLETWTAYLATRFAAAARPQVELPVIPLGVDCDAFPPQAASQSSRALLRDQLGIAADDVAILFVGRLSYHAKAHPLAMYTAVEEVCRRTGKPLHLLHFGWFANEGQRAHFQAAVRQFCPSVRAHFLDQREDLRESVWHASDVFISLSDNIQETFGLTPVEAMAAGLPQVVSDWSGYRDLVRHGVDGFRIPTLMPPPGTGQELIRRHALGIDSYDQYIGNASQSVAVDVASCITALEALVSNPELRLTMGNAGRQRALEVYDWRVVIAAYQQLWAELAARRRSARETPAAQPRPHPLRDDPFALFADFATFTLDGTCIVDLGPYIARLREIASMPMNKFATSEFCSERELHTLVDAIADEAPVLLGDLLGQVPAARPAIFARWGGSPRWTLCESPDSRSNMIDRKPIPQTHIAPRDGHARAADPPLAFQSSIDEIQWPALSGAYGSRLLALLFQLEQSQWWSPERIAAHQRRQLLQVVEYAERTVPFYRHRLAELGLDAACLASPSGWSHLPLLTRRDVQTSGPNLHATSLPMAHGRVSRNQTSGSTNQPVMTLGTEVTELFWRAITLRDHFWHRRDFSQPFAAVRFTGDASAMPPDGGIADNWGPATAGVVATGPAHLLNIQSAIEEQARWLMRVDPGYVLSYPSVLIALARIFAARGWQLPRLKEIRSFGEILEPNCRAECKRVFGVPVVDMYSSQEVGYIALQCPVSGGYHVQAENLIVEVLDDAGQPCPPGGIGKVVVTTLHNFAMPLLRYDIGDYAEVGGDCSCGRGLPVLKRILGRQRGLIVMPDGSRRWPVFNAGERPEELPPFYQFQVIQRSRECIDVLVVRDRQLLPEETQRVERYLCQTLGANFQVRVQRVDSIPRSPSGKFEDFICEAV